MGLEVDVRGVEVLAVLKNGNKRIAFAVVNALNKTIKDVQVAERRGVEKEFTLRKRDFVLREAAVVSKKNGGFANVASGRFQAQVQVGEKSRLLLSSFEKGGSRARALRDAGSESNGDKAAVPVVGNAARPSFGQQVPTTLRYKALAIRKDSKGMRKGKRGTFVVDFNKDGDGDAVIQRVGKGRGDTRMLYRLNEGQALEKRLGFEERARTVAMTKFPMYLQAEIRSSLAFAAARVFK
jgi:hypothetical protein